MSKGIDAIFEAARACNISLPDEVTAAINSENAIKDRAGVTSREWATKQNLVRDAELELIDEIIVAGREGMEMPDASSVMTAKHDQDFAQINSQVFGRALTEAKHDVANLVDKHSDEIVVAIKDAFDATLDEIRTNAAVSGGVLDADAAIAAGAKIIAARRELQTLAERFDALRQAQRAINNARSNKTIDDQGYFFEFRHPDRFEKREWHDSIERAVASATSDAGAWIPTIEEQDAAMREWQVANAPMLAAQRRAIERDGRETEITV